MNVSNASDMSNLTSAHREAGAVAGAEIHHLMYINVISLWVNVAITALGIIINLLVLALLAKKTNASKFLKLFIT